MKCPVGEGKPQKAFARVAGAFKSGIPGTGMLKGARQDAAPPESRPRGFPLPEVRLPAALCGGAEVPGKRQRSRGGGRHKIPPVRQKCKQVRFLEGERGGAFNKLPNEKPTNSRMESQQTPEQNINKLPNGVDIPLNWSVFRGEKTRGCLPPGKALSPVPDGAVRELPPPVHGGPAREKSAHPLFSQASAARQGVDNASLPPLAHLALTFPARTEPRPPGTEKCNGKCSAVFLANNADAPHGGRKRIFGLKGRRGEGRMKRR